MRYPLMACLILLAGCDLISGGRDNVVNGNDNLIVSDEIVDRLAAELSKLESTPAVTDADLAAVYARVREAAADGDLRASLVVLKLAAIQRGHAEDQHEGE